MVNVRKKPRVKNPKNTVAVIRAQFRPWPFFQAIHSQSPIPITAPTTMLGSSTLPVIWANVPGSRPVPGACCSATTSICSCARPKVARL